MNSYWTRYLPGSVRTLVYMLQASDYKVSVYWRWLLRARDLRAVSRRGKLVMTTKAKLLFAVLALVYLLLWLAVICMSLLSISMSNIAMFVAVLLLIIVLPWIVALIIIPPLWLGEVLIQKPRATRILRDATNKMASHSAHKIAIAGSYGKTTMKETLKTILSVKLDTAATPGNLNTPLGTAQFVRHLSGQEEVVIFELGESRVGDVAELCEITQPDMGIITGINEAHLESFGSLEHTVDTIFELGEYLRDESLYKNAESELVAERIMSDDSLAYSAQGVNGWQVSGVQSGLGGTIFRVHKGDIQLKLHSGLLGEYQVGPLVACIDIAYQLGLAPEEIIEGVSYTKPFAHRMQPHQQAGAWVIDDTYNGNPQGVAAGLEFLENVGAGGRKIYVTPGLVEQGNATKQVHTIIGERAAFCDVVVLMQNSTTKYIQAGLERAGFAGELHLIDDPLAFYQNISSFVAKGDVVLMQNDWTDNYV